MSKTTTAPEPEAVSANVPAAPVAPAAEAVATPEPVAAKVPAGKAAARKPAPAKRAAAVDTEKVAKTGALPPAAKPVKESKARKVAPKKPKLVRDSFTFPENDYALLAELKQRALKAGHEIKKSELLRAGLAALAAMDEQDLVIALAGVERIKTGRPSK